MLDNLEKEQLKALSEIKKNDRLILVKMDDDKAPLPFTKGTVIGIDSILTIHMNWDDGNILGLLPGIDAFYIIPKVLSEVELEYKNNPSFRVFFNKYMTDKKINDWVNQLDFIYIGPEMFMLDKFDVKFFANDFKIEGVG